MNVMPINPDFVPLLQGVKPFLGGKGQNLTDLTLNFVELLSSRPGVEAMKLLSKNLDPQNQSLDGTSPTQFAFILFLILILLILGSNLLMSYDKTSLEEQPVSSGEINPPNEFIGEM